MLSQSEWNERLRQRIATIHHALETGQDIDRSLLTLVLANVDALLGMYERHSAIIANVHAVIDGTNNAMLGVDLKTTCEQVPTTSPLLKLKWHQIPSNNLVMYGAKLGEYIAEVWQLEDGAFRAWVREISCVLRSDSGLVSLDVAQTIAEQLLGDLLATKARELDALRTAFNKGTTT